MNSLISACLLLEKNVPHTTLGRSYRTFSIVQGFCQGVDYTYTVKMLHLVFRVKGSTLESTPDVQTADLVLI